MSGGRIRSIKPEWLEDERLALASSDARVLSIAFILLADDAGNGRANEVMLAARVFPGKPVAVLKDSLDELVALGFVVLYEVDGQHYFEIRNWRKHQKIDRPSPGKVPPRQASTQDDSDHPREPSRASGEPSREQLATQPALGSSGVTTGNSNGSLSLASTRESSRVNHEPSSGPRASRASIPLPSIPGPSPEGVQGEGPFERRLFAQPQYRVDVKAVWEIWCKAFDKPNAKLDHRRAQAIADRLDEGASSKAIAAAFRGARLDEWVASKGFQISLILGDRERFEHLVELGTSGRRTIERGADAPVQTDPFKRAEVID